MVLGRIHISSGLVEELLSELISHLHDQSIYMTSWDLAAELEKRLVHRSLEHTENNREAEFLMCMLEQL